jgi:DNA-binding NarL/FixJ family response regulator
LVNARITILVVEDQEFLASMISAGLTNAGHEVLVKFSIADAIAQINLSQPNVVITDLNFGLGPSGLDLIDFLEQNYPWVGKIVLSAHQSASIATGKPWTYGSEVPYIVKSEVDSLGQIEAAIHWCLSEQKQQAQPKRANDLVRITKAQAEVLRLVGEGLSNSAVAKARGTTIRAVETLLVRTYESLAILGDPNIDPRVVAVRLLQTGQVAVE